LIVVVPDKSVNRGPRKQFVQRRASLAPPWQTGNDVAQLRRPIGLANASASIRTAREKLPKLSGDRPDDAFDQIVGAPEATVIEIEGLGGNHVAFCP
jgi:hypothetical protein